MQPLAGQGMPPARTNGAAGGNPNQILNDCRAIDESLDQLEYALQDLEQSQRSFISNANGSTAAIDSQAAEIMSQYRSLTERVRKVKSSPVSGDPRNAPQVGKVDRRLKKAIQEYQRQDSDFRKQVTDQQMRQYRIVRPDATDEEVRDAVGEGSGQIFQQALMQSDRRGAAQSALRSVQARHDAIQKIERDIIELSQLFQDLDTLVMEQEPLVQNIEQKAEDTKTNVEQGGVQLDSAIVSARARNRKKWWCLLIVGMLPPHLFCLKAVNWVVD
jgi:syntaxin 1B/2/3